MKLSDILSPELIRAPLLATQKVAAITELVDLLASTNRLTDRDSVLRAVLEREGTRSTGIGHGLAVPHGKCAGCPRLVMAIGRPETPIDFDSMDGKPVEMIVLLASPQDETGPHIQALARISRLMLMDDFRREVLAAQSPQQIYDLIAQYER